MHGQGKVAELKNFFNTGDTKATAIATMWDKFSLNRIQKMKDILEIRQYVFATDTTMTSNRKLSWNHKTTLPKICQIRDNLHANYMQALFPNDEWLTWEAYSVRDDKKDKAEKIKAYMENKTRLGGFKEEVSKLVYDYIDTGNAFCYTEFVKDAYTNDEGEEVINYIGPRVRRISINDIVFNPLSPTFEESPKIIRSLTSIGDLKLELETVAEKEHVEAVIQKMQYLRSTLSGYKADVVNKAAPFSIEGFGDYTTYCASGMVEVLDFWGNWYDPVTGDFKTNQHIVVVDRMYAILEEDIKTWTGKATIRHVGWRSRPDNLYAMGPLDNLVGMQYYLDHIQNSKADALDILVHPPLKVKGRVEEFNWSPNENIFLGDDGDVGILAIDAGIAAADNQIGVLMALMEEFAGAPKQAMGIRTPGEKTAYEVQTLENRSDRLFGEKSSQFETSLLEPVLNDMLQESRRNLDIADTVRVMDDDLGVQDFIQVSKEDLTASGKIRPVGARHFAARALLVQNIQGFFQGVAQDQGIRPHISGKAIAKLLEEALGLRKFDLVSDNVQVEEQLETQSLAQTAQRQLQQEGAAPSLDEQQAQSELDAEQSQLQG